MRYRGIPRMALGVVLTIGVLGGVVAFYSYYSHQIAQANDNR